MHRNRQPRGLPVGGQFATSDRAEATATLEPSGPDPCWVCGKAPHEPVGVYPNSHIYKSSSDHIARMDDPDEDALEFARKTLGPHASDDAVRELAYERSARALREHRAFFPRQPLTTADTKHLADNRGRFANGYDSDDINSFLREFESARIVCVWDYSDDDGYGGSSEFAGISRNPDGGGEAGSWRPMNPDVWAYLSEPDGLWLDPAEFKGLLADEVFEGPYVEDLDGDGFANVAVEHRVPFADCAFDLSTADDYDMTRHEMTHPGCHRGG